MSETPTPPAGWFVNPEDESELRYWNGAEWTALRRVRAATEPPPAPYGAAPSTPSAHAIGVTPLLVGGALLILAGIGRGLSYLLSVDAYAVSTAAAWLEVAGWTGAFIAFLVAGYPNRASSTRAVTAVLVGVYGLGGSLTVALSATIAARPGSLLIFGLIGLLTFGLGFAFAVITLRCRWIETRLRALPLALYLGLIVFGVLASAVNAAIAAGAPIPLTSGVVVAGASGVVPLVVGALLLAFGREPYASKA